MTHTDRLLDQLSHSGVYKWRFSWNSASPKGLLRCKFHQLRGKDRDQPNSRKSSLEHQEHRQSNVLFWRDRLEFQHKIVWARGEWDHFIYSESAYITVVTLNCPCCNGKCVPKLNGINRMIDERSHEPRLDQDSRLWILSHICFGVSVWWMRSFYLFWIGLSNCCDAELSSL